MRNLFAISAALVLIAGAGAQQTKQTKGKESGAAWTILFNGTSLDNWNTIGTANWKLAGGVVEASSGNGLLVSKATYKDFELRAEFWVDGPANSGVFVRCTNAQEITPDNAYEVNVYDTRPDQTYATGSIVNVAPPSTPMKTAGKWNTFEITAQGTHLVVTLNGTKTVDVRNDKFPAGAIGLQYAAGVVKFRSVQIRPL
ncbi:MAG: DUF1080 domain-containing protein [Acidobacteriota bacterium]